MLETIASWHPFIVHFAVAFAMGSAAFDILDFFLHRPSFERTGFHLLVAALPFLLLAVLSGNLAETYAEGLAAAALELDTHMTYANIAVWLFTAVGFWRIFMHVRKEFTDMRKIVYVFLITAAAMSVYLAALHGGSIIHG